MLLSLLLADRISALKRQTRSAFIIAAAFTPATRRPQLISGKCLSGRPGELGGAHCAWWRGNCLCCCLRGTGWASPGGSWHRKPTAWGERYGLSWLVAAEGDLPPLGMALAGHCAPHEGPRAAQMTVGSLCLLHGAGAPLACQELIGMRARREKRAQGRARAGEREQTTWPELSRDSPDLWHLWCTAPFHDGQPQR